jgi:hypothetical protein
MLQRFEELRERTVALEGALRAALLDAPEGAEELSQGSDEVELLVRGGGYGDGDASGHLAMPWDQIFYIIGPLMIDEASEEALRARLGEELFQRASQLREFKRVHFYRNIVVLDEDDFQQIKVQLRALGLITMSQRRRGVKDTNTYWALTPRGDAYLVRLRAMRRDDASKQPKPEVAVAAPANG